MLCVFILIVIFKLTHSLKQHRMRKISSISWNVCSNFNLKFTVEIEFEIFRQGFFVHFSSFSSLFVCSFARTACLPGVFFLLLFGSVWYNIFCKLRTLSKSDETFNFEYTRFGFFSLLFHLQLCRHLFFSIAFEFHAFRIGQRWINLQQNVSWFKRNSKWNVKITTATTKRMKIDRFAWAKTLSPRNEWIAECSLSWTRQILVERQQQKHTTKNNTQLSKYKDNLLSFAHSLAHNDNAHISAQICGNRKICALCVTHNVYGLFVFLCVNLTGCLWWKWDKAASISRFISISHAKIVIFDGVESFIWNEFQLSSMRDFPL